MDWPQRTQEEAKSRESRLLLEAGGDALSFTRFHFLRSFALFAAIHSERFMKGSDLSQERFQF
jgi:hypothetical protein